MFEKLYKYKSVDKNLESLIDNSELFFPGRLLLNDPNESILRFLRKQELVDDGASESRIVALEVPHFASIDSYFYFCMSSINWNIPLWSYYGSGHKGVCLEFNFDNAIPQSLDDPDKPWKIETDHGTPFIRKIEYHKNVDNYLLDPQWQPNLTADEQAMLGFRKLSCWEHEREVRLRMIPSRETVWDELGGMRWKFEKHRLTGVYFGLKTPPEERESIIMRLKGNGFHPKLFQAYDIDFEDGSQKVRFKPVVGSEI